MASLIARDLHHVWHPCSQMKDFETCPPLVVNSAQGAYLYTDRGPLIDAISSWWCKSLGHGHPAVIAAIKDQLTQFEHVIGANTTHPKLVELAEQLTAITRKQHVFFASDGATAVEIAMKLAVHAQALQGRAHKNTFIALQHGYHGESFGTLSVSDLGMFKAPFAALSFPCHFIQDLPYLHTTADPLWNNCDAQWQSIVQQLEAVCDNACALILEPIVQGAGGMRCYSKDLLHKLAAWAKAKGIYFIADEIMTGMGRTGEWLACDHAQISPDLICLSKGLTSGSVPLSCVMIDHSIYNLFYADYQQGNSFLHSNTYSGNPLAIAAALATIKTFHQENIVARARALEKTMLTHLQQVATASGKLQHVRGIGGVVAADLVPSGNARLDQAVYQSAIQHGALLRPIGNTLYWLPPLNIDEEIIGKLAQITLHSIKDAYQGE